MPAKKDPEKLLLTQPTEEDKAMFAFYRSNPDIACRDLLHQDLAPFQRKVLNGVMTHKFVISVLARGSGKTRMMAMSAALLAMFNQKMRVGFLAPGFRQSKLAFLELMALYDESEHLQASISRISRQTDIWLAEFHNGAVIFALPLSADNPASIRGMRAHAILIDEYPHVPKEILDAVINPMLATNRNPMVNVRRIEKQKQLKEMGIDVPMIDTNKNKICGFSSAYFQFNHMYQTIQDYKKFAKEEKLKTGKSEHAVYVFNYKDAPEGFFDATIIEHSRQTSSELTFAMEYLSEFPSDSAGFYKRSLVDSCISKVPNEFYLELTGDPKFRYFIGIDPARSSDALAISIVKLVGEQMRLVRVVTFEDTPFPEVAEYIRGLLRDYNVEMIGMDAGGGGSALKDLLCNPMTATNKNDIILDMDDENNYSKEGRKILRMIDFHAGWISEANFEMRASLEHKKLVFPCYDIANTYLKPSEDSGDLNDTAIQEYFAAIEELVSIVMTQTAKMGNLHFDTQKKHGRKDRYSSLLIAHKILYDLIKNGYQQKQLATGGFLGTFETSREDGEEEWKETVTLEEIQERAFKLNKRTNITDGALQ